MVMATVLFLTLGLFLLSFPVEVKKVCFGVIEDILYCKSIVKKGSLIPQVCGKCELEVKGGKLYIKPPRGCPRYDALLCRLKSGEIFFINNLSCKPRSGSR